MVLNAYWKVLKVFSLWQIQPDTRKARVMDQATQQIDANANKVRQKLIN